MPQKYADLLGSPLKTVALGSALGAAVGAGRSLLRGKDESENKSRLRSLLRDMLYGAAVGGAAAGTLRLGLVGADKFRKAYEDLKNLPISDDEKIRAIIEAANTLPPEQRHSFMIQHGLNPYSVNLEQYEKKGEDEWASAAQGALTGGLGLGGLRALLSYVTGDDLSDVLKKGLFASTLGAALGGVTGYGLQRAGGPEGLWKAIKGSPENIWKAIKEKWDKLGLNAPSKSDSDWWDDIEKALGLTGSSPAGGRDSSQSRDPNLEPDAPYLDRPKWKQFLDAPIERSRESLTRGLGPYNWSLSGITGKAGAGWLAARGTRWGLAKYVEHLLKTDEGKRKILKALMHVEELRPSGLLQQVKKIPERLRGSLLRWRLREMPSPLADPVGYASLLQHVAKESPSAAAAELEKVLKNLKGDVARNLQLNMPSPLVSSLADLNARAARAALERGGIEQLIRGVTLKDIAPKPRSWLRRGGPWTLLAASIAADLLGY